VLILSLTTHHFGNISRILHGISARNILVSTLHSIRNVSQKYNRAGEKPSQGDSTFFDNSIIHRNDKKVKHGTLDFKNAGKIL